MRGSLCSHNAIPKLTWKAHEQSDGNSYGPLRNVWVWSATAKIEPDPCSTAHIPRTMKELVYHSWREHGCISLCQGIEYLFEFMQYWKPGSDASWNYITTTDVSKATSRDIGLVFITKGTDAVGGACFVCKSLSDDVAEIRHVACGEGWIPQPHGSPEPKVAPNDWKDWAHLTPRKDFMPAVIPPVVWERTEGW